MIRILVTVEGGIVQSVSTNKPLPEDVEVVVCDYDSESASEDRSVEVPQDEEQRDFAAAILSRPELGTTQPYITEFIDNYFKE